MALGVKKTSVLTAGSNSHPTTSEEANYFPTDFVISGILNAVANTNGFAPATGGFAVNAHGSPDMGVAVTPGTLYALATPTGQNSQRFRVGMAGTEDVTIAANASGSTVYDWIYVKIDPTLANNPDLNATTVATIVVSRSTSSVTDTGSPPAFGYNLCVVTVVNGAVSIANAAIADKRAQASINTPQIYNTNGWLTAPAVFAYAANNGNKEFTMTVSGDQTGVLWPGMRFKADRNTTPPSQCMAFTAASSQYATKAAPAGITFTGAFSAEAWIYLNSYTGQEQAIIGRTDSATGGFALCIRSNGQVRLYYGGSSTFTDFVSSQSVPLNRWSHIAGVCTSVAAKTALIYINGNLVTAPASLTAATTLVQTSNLSVGAHGAGIVNSFFNGFISEARIWSAAQTQASVQANMAINLVGNEANLVALFKGGGNFNDATANANNLTATNGAIATQASNPFNTTEQFLIHRVAFSGGITTLTLFGGTDYNLPNMQMNNQMYSTQKSPYGFPINKEKWVNDVYLRTDSEQSSPVSGTWYNQPGHQILALVGSWRTYYEATQYGYKPTAVNVDSSTTLSNANNTEWDQDLSQRQIIEGASSTLDLTTTSHREKNLLFTVDTLLYLNFRPNSASMSTLGLRGDLNVTKIVMESGYL